MQFIEKTGIYAVHTQMGKGVLCDASEYSLFAAGIHRRDYVNCGIDRADLIITIGYNIVEYPPYVWNNNLDKKIINIDFTEAEVDKYYDPDIEVIGDISCSLRQLGELIDGQEERRDLQGHAGIPGQETFARFQETVSPDARRKSCGMCGRCCRTRTS